MGKIDKLWIGHGNVLSGELTEAIHQPGLPVDRSLLDRPRSAGTSVGFGAHYVHDVHNLGDRPAVSVHAYSRPLTSMSFYDLAEFGTSLNPANS